MSYTGCLIGNGEAVPFAGIPILPNSEFRRAIARHIAEGSRLSSLFGAEIPGEQALRLIGVVADDRAGLLSVLSTFAENEYPALTPDCAQAHMFERELAEQWGVLPLGHPWLRPARFQERLLPKNGLRFPEKLLPGSAEFFAVQGEEVHEVAVGPVHAGVIEPGHFRFQCHGEQVFHLEVSLGYAHRGIERALLRGPHKRTLYQIEAAAGDTTIGHTVAYCRLLEALSGTKISRRAEALRAAALELERLANHTGDLGALGGDVGYLPTAAYCGRIRGDFLNMTALICGSRLGRGCIVPGGVRFDLDKERNAKLSNLLLRAKADAASAIELLWKNSTVMSRFEHTGAVSLEDCRALGLVGPAARACGSTVDVRKDFPFGQYRETPVPDLMALDERNGDVFARAFIRWAEINNSLGFLGSLLPLLPEGALDQLQIRQPRLSPNMFAVSLVEGWRGEICHTVITDGEGRFVRYKIVDPSFHNWIGLGMALRGQQISDFPLCNKSFNLSYCGFDL